MAVKLLLLLALMAPAGGWAATYTVKSTKCRVLVLKKRKWVRTRKRVIRRGSRVSGRPARRGSSLIVFRKGRSRYAVSRKCLKPARTIAKRKRAPTKLVKKSKRRRPRYRFRYRKRSRSYFTGVVSFFSWQEPLKLASSTESFNVLTTHVGLCPGLNWHYRLFRHLEAGLTGCGMVGLSEAAESTGEGAPPIIYRVKRSKVFGLQAGPAIYWIPKWESVHFGLIIPIVFRTGTWPQPGQGFEVSPVTVVAPGYFLEARFGAKYSRLSLRMGFFRTFDSLSWSLGYQFDI